MRATILFTILLCSLLQAGAQISYPPGNYYFVPVEDTAGKFYLSARSSNGNISHPVTEAIYDEMEYASEDLVLVKKDGKYGFLDTLGNVAIAIVYDNSSSFNDGVAIVFTDCHTGILSKNGSVIILSKQYEHVYPFNENRTVVTLNGLYGIINKTGREIVPLQYRNLEPFSNYRSVFIDTLGLEGAVDTNGVIAVQPRAVSLGVFNHLGYAYTSVYKAGDIRSYNDRKRGLVYKDGTVIIPEVYDNIDIEFPDDDEEPVFLISVQNSQSIRKDDFFNFLRRRSRRRHTLTTIIDTAIVFNQQGKILYAGKQRVYNKDAVNANTQVGDTLYFINATGQIKKVPGIANTTGYRARYNDYILYTTTTGKQGLFTLSGNNIIAPIYTTINNVGYIFDHLYALRPDTVDVYDKNFTLVKKVHADTIKDAQWVFKKVGEKREKNIYHIFYYKGLAGLLDSTFNPILAAKYNALQITADGIFFKQNGKYGFMNLNYEIVLQPLYTEIKPTDSYNTKSLFKIAVPGKKGKLLYGLAASNGNVMLPPVYNNIEIRYRTIKVPYNGTEINRFIPYYLVNKNGKFGLADSNMNFVFDPIYQRIKFNDTLVALKKDKKYALYNVFGKAITGYNYSGMYFDDGYIIVSNTRKKGHWGLMTTNATMLIPFDYDDITVMKRQYGLYAVLTIKNKEGLATINGKIIYPCEYNRIERDFVNETTDCFKLQKGNKMGIGNSAGNIIIPIEYFNIVEWVELYNLQKKENDTLRYGVATPSGKIIIEANYLYKQITHYRGTIILEADGKRYFYNAQGQSVNDCYIDKHIGDKGEQSLPNRFGRGEVSF